MLPKEGRGAACASRAEAADNDLGEEVSSEEQVAQRMMRGQAALKLHNAALGRLTPELSRLAKQVRLE